MYSNEYDILLNIINTKSLVLSKNICNFAIVKKKIEGRYVYINFRL